MANLVPGDPTHVGGYLLARRLGAGGQGVVYEGYDKTGRRHAVKIMQPELLGRPDVRARLTKEVLAARRVAPFCTAPLIAADLDGDLPHVVSEYISGPTLQQAIEEHGPLGPAALHHLAVGVATALTAIHQVGVVHRDLKPHNIILGADGPRVIDFGIARVAGTTLTSDSSRVGGTPAYMSPEQVNSEVVGSAADIWAWGGVVLFAATGELPFGRGEITALYHRILTSAPDLSPLDGTLRELVHTSMTRDPSRRPTARALLRALLGGTGGTTSLLTAGRDAARTVTPPEPDADPSLGELAENVYVRLDPGCRARVPGFFLRLVQPGDGSDFSVGHVDAESLRDAETPPAVMDEIVAAFAEAGVVVRFGESVTLPGPALVYAWPRLRTWLDASRDTLRVVGPLGRAAQGWHRSGRTPAELYQGAALRTALAWWSGGESELLRLNPLERAFLAASAARERLLTWRRRRVRSGVAILLAVSLSVGVVAVVSAESERRQQEVIAAKEAATRANALRATDPVAAQYLSVAAWELARDEPQAVRALYDALAQRETHLLPPLIATGTVLRYALSADGRRVVLNDGTATWTDLATGGTVGRVTGVSRDPTAMTVSADGKTLVVGTAEDVELWRPTGGGPARFGSGAAWLGLNRSGDVLTVQDPDGAWEIWDLTDLSAPMWREPAITVADVVVSPDGRSVFELLEDDGHRLGVARARGEPLSFRPIDGMNGVAAFSPDSGTLAVADGSGMRLVDIRSRKQTTFPLRGVDPRAVDYSSAGRYLIVDEGSAISLWTTGGKRVFRHTVQGAAEAMSFDEQTGALDLLLENGALRIQVTELAALRPLVHEARAAAFSDDTRYAVLAGRTVKLLDVTTGKSIRTLYTPRNPEGRVAFSADGRLLAYGEQGDAEVVIWNVPPQRRPLMRFPIPGNDIGGLAFDPKSGALAVAPVTTEWGDVQLWNVQRREWSGELGVAGSVRMTFSADGGLLASYGWGHYTLFDLRAGAAHSLTFGGTPGSVLSLTFSRDGKTMAIGRKAAGVEIWDSTGKNLLRQLRPSSASSDRFDVIALTRDGRMVAAGGDDGLLWLWNVEEDRPIGGPIPAHAAEVLALAFSPDGKTLHSIGADGRVLRTPVSPALVAAMICDRLGNPMKEQLWNEHIRNASFRKVC
ncbi:WD40 repeat domain-containing serine/threonine protein kinase [Herbidospora sp. RD11066]